MHTIPKFCNKGFDVAVIVVVHFLVVFNDLLEDPNPDYFLPS